MWKSGESLTAATRFYPQEYVDKNKVVNREKSKIFVTKLSTGILSTICTSCGKMDKQPFYCHCEPPKAAWQSQNKNEITNKN